MWTTFKISPAILYTNSEGLRLALIMDGLLTKAQRTIETKYALSSVKC